jgi:hypothetical protein
MIVYHYIPSKRLQKSYFRQWVRNDARNRGRMSRSVRPEAGTVLGAPPWMWRATMDAVFKIVTRFVGRGDEADRFKAELDVIEFAEFFAGHNLPWLSDKYINRA